MKKTIILFSVSALLMAVACNKETKVPEISVGEPVQITLHATRGGDAETKTTLAYNDEYASLESTWSVGDKVYVYNSDAVELAGVLTIGSAADITNTAGTQYPTSNAVFSGSITLGTNTIDDTFYFVYQGNRDKVDVVDGALEFEIDTSPNIAGLNKWDIAIGSGKLQAAESEGVYNCAVNFTNKVSFAYLTTKNHDSALDMQYYTKFKLDIKSQSISGSEEGEITLPVQQAFYMPVLPGNFKPSCGKDWSDDNHYSEVSLSKVIPVTTTAGYWRLGRSSSFGPVEFTSSAVQTYDVLASSNFSLGGENTVKFTPGNLQWNGLDTDDQYWTLASSQYEYLGNSNTAPTLSTNDQNFPDACKIDLFAWGNITGPFYCMQWDSDDLYTAGNIHEHGINAGNLNLDGADERGNDWGYTFHDGSVKLYKDKKNDRSFSPYTNLRVLTKDEWVALFNNNYWAFTTVSVDGVNKQGIAVLPGGKTDETAAAAVTLFGEGKYNSAASATVKTWTAGAIVTRAALEEAGCLFLPAAGFRNTTASASNVGTDGNYWSRTSYSVSKAYRVNFSSGSFYVSNNHFRSRGYSVRLAYWE